MLLVKLKLSLIKPDKCPSNNSSSSSSNVSRKVTLIMCHKETMTWMIWMMTGEQVLPTKQLLRKRALTRWFVSKSTSKDL